MLIVDCCVPSHARYRASHTANYKHDQQLLILHDIETAASPLEVLRIGIAQPGPRLNLRQPTQARNMWQVTLRVHSLTLQATAGLCGSQLPCRTSGGKQQHCWPIVFVGTTNSFVWKEVAEEDEDSVAQQESLGTPVNSNKLRMGVYWGTSGGSEPRR